MWAYPPGYAYLYAACLVCLCCGRYKDEYAEAIREIEAVKSEMETVKQKASVYNTTLLPVEHLTMYILCHPRTAVVRPACWSCFIRVFCWVVRPAAFVQQFGYAIDFTTGGKSRAGRAVLNCASHGLPWKIRQVAATNFEECAGLINPKDLPSELFWYCCCDESQVHFAVDHRVTTGVPGRRVWVALQTNGCGGLSLQHLSNVVRRFLIIFCGPLRSPDTAVAMNRRPIAVDHRVTAGVRVEGYEVALLT